MFCSRGVTLSRLCLCLVVFCLAACSDLTESERAILKACGTLDLDYLQTWDSAYTGNLEAIDCSIAIADRSLMPDAYHPGASVGWKYIKWLETGEEPEDIFELAATSTRRELDLTAFGDYLKYAEAKDMMPPMVFRDDGCMYRPLKYDRLWQVARSTPLDKPCEDAVIEHLDH